MDNSNKKANKLALAIGTGLTIGLASMSIANAQSSPFSATKLDSGYNLAGHHMDSTVKDKKADGKCGAGKCGGEKADKKADGKCGGEKGSKKADGKCGAGKCGGNH